MTFFLILKQHKNKDKDEEDATKYRTADSITICYFG
jgi:hypothetical protein